MHKIEAFSTAKCRSATHLAVQHVLQTLFGTHLCTLELPMAKIGRIADCAIPDLRLVFEIQCSPLSPQEALQRTADYAALNWQVVWILHDQLYNRLRVTKLERALHPIPHYYTNIIATDIDGTADSPSGIRRTYRGRGIIYDQIAIIRNHLRIFRSAPLSIDPTKPHASPFYKQFLSQQARFRASHWPLYFTGDLLDLNPPSFRALSTLARITRPTVLKAKSAKPPGSIWPFIWGQKTANNDTQEP